MKKFNIDIPRLLWNLLPPHKRQPVRFSLLERLTDLQPVWEGFDDWRTWQHRLINMDSSVMKLREYLRLKFGNEMDIRILPWTDELMMISLFSEGQFVYFGYEDEGMVSIPRLGEVNYNFGDADFVIIVPSGRIDTEALRIEIEKFNRIDVRFNIILQEDYEMPDELAPAAVLLILACALKDYLRTHSGNTGIEVIPHDEYLTLIPLLEEGTTQVELGIESYLSVPAAVSLLEEGKPAEAGISGDGGFPVPADGDAGIAGHLSGPNLAVVLPERTERLSSIRLLTELYPLLQTPYRIVERADT
ncbi:hypothetical protein EZS27_012232 [termite gut metagenome]|uniref:Uncharacterized protein n=1 Tax=termite gut metagenome TaxID=433724 RepID=A0A5J4S119_9ZZZZ